MYDQTICINHHYILPYTHNISTDHISRVLDQAWWGQTIFSVPTTNNNPGQVSDYVSSFTYRCFINCTSFVEAKVDWFVSGESERIWKEWVAVYFESSICLENDEKSQSGKSICRQSFEVGTSQIRSRSTNYSAAMYGNAIQKPNQT
jgi:hypothetical protein